MTTCSNGQHVEQLHLDRHPLIKNLHHGVRYERVSRGKCSFSSRFFCINNEYVTGLTERNCKFFAWKSIIEIRIYADANEIADFLLATNSTLQKSRSNLIFIPNLCPLHCKSICIHSINQNTSSIHPSIIWYHLNNYLAAFARNASGGNLSCHMSVMQI
jgi:hypothetical protein